MLTQSSGFALRNSHSNVSKLIPLAYGGGEFSAEKCNSISCYVQSPRFQRNRRLRGFWILVIGIYLACLPAGIFHQRRIRPSAEDIRV